MVSRFVQKNSVIKGKDDSTAGTQPPRYRAVSKC